MEPNKEIRMHTQQTGSTEYTVQINLQVPLYFTIVEPSHSNRLRISFSSDQGVTEKQDQIVKENPNFPLGIPIRSKGEDADILVDYGFKFYRNEQPDKIYNTWVRYVLPVQVKKSGPEEIILDEDLPLEELARQAEAPQAPS